MNVVNIDKSPTGGDALLTFGVVQRPTSIRKTIILLHHVIQLKVTLGPQPLVNILNLAWLMNCDQKQAPVINCL